MALNRCEACGFLSAYSVLEKQSWAVGSQVCTAHQKINRVVSSHQYSPTAAE